MISKVKKFLKPVYSDITKGSIHAIYGYRDDGSQYYEGEAELIEPCLSWRKPYPYVKYESRENKDSNSVVINWMYTRWTVRFISGNMKGHTACRNIHYFYSIGDQVSNPYDTRFDDEEE